MAERPLTSETPETPSRAKTLLASNAFRAGVVVLAAAIIFGAWAFAEFAGDGASDDGPAVVLTLDDEYERARLAAESGDTDEAIAILERVLAEDPDHERAQALLRQLTGAGDGDDDGTPAGTDGPGDDSTPPDGGAEPDDSEDPEEPAPRDDTAYLVAASDLDALLPQVISAWQRGSSVVSDTDATVPFMPSAANPLSRALYSVHDRGSAEEALAFVENTSKIAFSADGTPVRVGVLDGYFGTDGTRLATIAFARGRFAFEVVVTVPDGAPVSAKDAAVELAQAFEATR